MNPVTGRPSAATSSAELRDMSLAALKRYNIMNAVLSGPAQDVRQWREVARDRIIPGAFMYTGNPLPDLAALRTDMKAGRVEVLGELALQYLGIAPNDPVMEPYFALAEEMGIPVGVHTGISFPGTPYDPCCPKFAQFRLLDVDDTDVLLAEEIIGNVDEDGYLRRELSLIVQDLNLTFGLSIPESKAEAVLQKILQLDPPGIAARDLRECLLAQIKADSLDPVLKELAQKVVELHFEDFKLKRFDSLAQKLHVGTDTLRKVIDALHHLNPRPGEGKFTAQENYVTPDFIVDKDDGDSLSRSTTGTSPPCA